MTGAPDFKPYPGLRPFREDESRIFFGRADQIGELYRLLDFSRFVAVVGGSGSGKSSLVKAGLLPLLAGEKTAAGKSRWNIVQMRPGSHPVERLAEAIREASHAGQDKTPQSVVAALRQTSAGLVDVLHETLPAARETLLLVDQFEELFRYADLGREGADHALTVTHEDEARRFVDLLVRATTHVGTRVRVLITMRSDFLGDCSRFRGLAEAVSRTQFLVPRLFNDQIGQAIVGPLVSHAHRIEGDPTVALNLAEVEWDDLIEPELVEQLKNDTGEDPDQLPVLQHALLRCWTAVGGGRLTLAKYKELGGWGVILSRHADEVMRDCGPGLAKTVENLFRSITELDTRGRKIRRPGRILQIAEETGEEPDDLRKVVAKFSSTDCAFLQPITANADERVDIGHEALIRNWYLLRDEWIPAEDIDAGRWRSLRNTMEDQNRLNTGLIEWWYKRHPSVAWIEKWETPPANIIAEVAAFVANSKAEHEQDERLRMEVEEADARLREAELERAKAALDAAQQKAKRARNFAVLAVMLLLAVGAAGVLYLRSTTFQVQANLDRANSLWSDLDTNQDYLTDSETEALWRLSGADQGVRDIFIQQLLGDADRLPRFGRLSQPIMRAIGLDWPTPDVAAEILENTLVALENARYFQGDLAAAAQAAALVHEPSQADRAFDKVWAALDGYEGSLYDISPLQGAATTLLALLPDEQVLPKLDKVIATIGSEHNFDRSGQLSQTAVDVVQSLPDADLDAALDAIRSVPAPDNPSWNGIAQAIINRLPGPSASVALSALIADLRDTSEPKRSAHLRKIGILLASASDKPGFALQSVVDAAEDAFAVLPQQRRSEILLLVEPLSPHLSSPQARTLAGLLLSEVLSDEMTGSMPYSSQMEALAPRLDNADAAPLAEMMLTSLEGSTGPRAATLARMVMATALNASDADLSALLMRISSRLDRYDRVALDSIASLFEHAWWRVQTDVAVTVIDRARTLLKATDRDDLEPALLRILVVLIRAAPVPDTESFIKDLVFKATQTTSSTASIVASLVEILAPSLDTETSRTEIERLLRLMNSPSRGNPERHSGMASVALAMVGQLSADDAGEILTAELQDVLGVYDESQRTRVLEVLASKVTPQLAAVTLRNLLGAKSGMDTDAMLETLRGTAVELARRLEATDARDIYELTMAARSGYLPETPPSQYRDIAATLLSRLSDADADAAVEALLSSPVRDSADDLGTFIAAWAERDNPPGPRVGEALATAFSNAVGSSGISTLIDLIYYAGAGNYSDYDAPWLQEMWTSASALSVIQSVLASARTNPSLASSLGTVLEPLSEHLAPDDAEAVLVSIFETIEVSAGDEYLLVSAYNSLAGRLDTAARQRTFETLTPIVDRWEDQYSRAEFERTARADVSAQESQTELLLSDVLPSKSIAALRRALNVMIGINSARIPGATVLVRVASTLSGPLEGYSGNEREFVMFARAARLIGERLRGLELTADKARAAVAWKGDNGQRALYAGIFTAALPAEMSPQDRVAAILDVLKYPTAAGLATAVLLDALDEIAGDPEVDGPGRDAGLKASLDWAREAYPALAASIDRPPACPAPLVEGPSCPS